MKKITFAIGLFVLSCSFTFLADASKDIVGKWKLSESSYPAARKALVERVRKMSPEQAEQLEAVGEQLNELIGMITYEYKSDGNYEITTPQGPQAGTWTISSDGKYLERKGAQGTRKDSIIEIKPNKLTFFDLDIKEKMEYEKAQ